MNGFFEKTPSLSLRLRVARGGKVGGLVRRLFGACSVRVRHVFGLRSARVRCSACYRGRS